MTTRELAGWAAKALQAEYYRADAASTRLAKVRASLPQGSTRARVTTANARWARAAEHRDRIAALLHEADRIARGEG